MGSTENRRRHVETIVEYCNGPRNIKAKFKMTCKASVLRIGPRNTGTTVYVVAVLAVIPIAGAFAWFARVAIRRKVKAFI
jgi:hypothetical protein